MNKFLAFLFVYIVSFACFARDMKVHYLPTQSNIPEHNIVDVFRDSNGYMWYAGVNSLYRDDGYNIETIKIGADCEIREISQDYDGNIWVASDIGAFLIDKDTYKITIFDEQKL